MRTNGFGIAAPPQAQVATFPGNVYAAAAVLPAPAASAGSHAAAPHEVMFLFVNPRSGGNRGEAFLQAPQPFYTRVSDGRQVALHIYSLLEGESGNKKGFHALREKLQTLRKPIRVVVGGGDGTVMWADQEAQKHGIDTSRQLIYGIVPLGTGNDFARFGGWGGRNPKRILEDDFQVLRDLICEWADALPRPHDVWEVTLQVADNGDILQVDGESQEASLSKRSLTMPMLNYFSVGQESKVGIAFDKRRTKSQTCNVMVYLTEGILAELPCSSQQHIGSLVSTVHQGTDTTGRVLLSTDDDEHQVVGNPESLIVLNINSYAGGKAHFWQTGVDNFGVEPRPAAADVEVECDPGDGRLEVMTLPNIADIALDRIVHAARRVASCSPLFIDFLEDEVNDLDAFAEVDGEYYHLVNPLWARITLKKRLTVLHKRDE